MADEQPGGPDLSLGVPLASLAEGKPLLGHVGGDPAILVRRGDAVHAIGATCTHYNGPLAEGLVVGGTIRCPWHHACFDLETGAASRPPALRPVACWQVERTDGLVRVGARKPARAPTPTKGPSSVLIVGAGAAGAVAALTLREEGYAGPVTLLGADESPPVDRPNLSKDYLAGSAPEEWMPLFSPDEWAEREIRLRTGVRVTALDPEAKSVTLSDGDTLEYGALLLATGAEPIRLDVPGADRPFVHVLRTHADGRAIVARAKDARRAVVIGASFIGLEVASSLRARGLEVDVVAPERRPLERVMGPEVGDFVRSVHEKNGVRFHLGQTAASVGEREVVTSGGEKIGCDLVVVGIGVRPSVDLAERAGIRVDRGVLVDPYLATSVLGVWAAGDIAKWPDPHGGEAIRVEHWVVAERQGRTAARNILGRRERFDAVPFFWTTQFDLTLSYVGHASAWDRIEIDGSLDRRDCTIRFVADRRTLAVVTVGRDGESLRVEAEMESGARRGE